MGKVIKIKTTSKASWMIKKDVITLAHITKI